MPSPGPRFPGHLLGQREVALEVELAELHDRLRQVEDKATSLLSYARVMAIVLGVNVSGNAAHWLP